VRAGTANQQASAPSQGAANPKQHSPVSVWSFRHGHDVLVGVFKKEKVTILKNKKN